MQEIFDSLSLSLESMACIWWKMLRTLDMDMYLLMEAYNRHKD